MGLRIVNGVPYFDGKSGGFAAGTRACSSCLRRPARVDRSGQQRWCRVCATEDMRQRRRGKTELLVDDGNRGLVRAIERAGLSAEERDLIIETIIDLRAKPGGRHHRAEA